MVEVLSGRNCSPRAGADAVSELKCSTKQDETDNPARVPMASKKPQACCRSLSSWTLATFPRCFSERNSTSAGVKYGWWKMEDGTENWLGESMKCLLTLVLLYLREIHQVVLLLTLHCREMRNEKDDDDESRTFGYSAQEMFMSQLRRTFPQSNHSSLDTDSLQLRRIEFICTSCQLFIIHIRRHGHFS